MALAVSLLNGWEKTSSRTCVVHWGMAKWWAILVSNQWPLPCEGSALPLS